MVARVLTAFTFICSFASTAVQQWTHRYYLAHPKLTATRFPTTAPAGPSNNNPAFQGHAGGTDDLQPPGFMDTGGHSSEYATVGMVV